MLAANEKRTRIASETARFIAAAIGICRRIREVLVCR